MEEPPKIERPNTTKPNIFFPNSKHAIQLVLLIGRKMISPVIPKINPNHKLSEWVVALQTITTNYDKNKIAVTYSLFPLSKAFAKHNNQAKLKTLDNKPIPSNFMLNSYKFEKLKKTIRNRIFMKNYAVHVRLRLKWKSV